DLFRTPQRVAVEVSLSSSGGEGRGEEAYSLISAASSRDRYSCPFVVTQVSRHSARRVFFNYLQRAAESALGAPGQQQRPDRVNRHALSPDYFPDILRMQP